MYQPLEDAVFAFAEAREDAIQASKASGGVPSPTEYKALAAMAALADGILQFLGYIEPYECGECDACQANAAARRESMQSLVDDDPDLSPPHLSEADEDAFRKLLGDVFGDGAR